MTTAKTVLAIAASQLGVSENPAGSHFVKYNQWYGVDGICWCATFVSWVMDNAGLTELHGIQNSRGSAFCPYIEDYYRAQDRWQRTPHVGAIVLFDWDREGTSDHIGFVETVLTSEEIITIEGNTSATDKSNGGQVQRQTRYSPQIRGYGMPLYQPEEPEQRPLDRLTYDDLEKPQLYLTSPLQRGVVVAYVQETLLQQGYTVEIDGVYGTATEKAVKGFQHDHKLDVDGWVGSDTWQALFQNA